MPLFDALTRVVLILAGLVVVVVSPLLHGVFGLLVLLFAFCVAGGALGALAADNGATHQLEVERGKVCLLEMQMRYQTHQLPLPKLRSVQRSRKGYVYLLAVLDRPGVYKIGRTANPDNRLRTFHVKLPFAVEYDTLIQTEDMYALEAQLHARFNAQRLDGSEFFALADEDVAYIRSLAKQR